MYTRFLYPSPVANGDSWFQVGVELPKLMHFLLLIDLNIELRDTVPNNNTVFVIGANGAVGVVKYCDINRSSFNQSKIRYITIKK